MSEDSKPASGLDATLSAVGSAPRAEATAPSGADVPLAPGATLGRYVLVDRLGAGGMGMVFRARDPDLGREVAIKVLRTGDGSGGGLERRLLREAQAMATVSHDNLANVFDIGTTGGRVFIAMELVDGGTLRALFADEAKTWRDKLAAVTAAGRGLAAAHSAGVIHRDFKPDNVLIAKNGRVKVVDFGLARADRGPDLVETSSGKSGRADGALPADLSAQLTQTGALLGTPAYMAPEQHAGELVDARSDQFGFAVTAWEAVYGGRPFVSDAYSSLVSAVRSHQTTPPPKVAGVPAALEAALRRALSPAPSDRFSSMDTLLDAIDRAIRPRGRRTALIAASAGALLIGGGIATYAIVSDNAAETPPTAARPTVKNKLGDGSATQVRVTVIPFDLSNLDEFKRGSGDRGEAAIGRMLMTQALESHGEEIGACYQEAGIDRPGRVAIEFTVRPDGRVASFRTTEDNFPETGIASCVGAKAMLWSFPPANNGETRVVTFPFQFSPGESGEDGEREGFPFDPNIQIDIPGLVGMAARLAGGIDEVGDNHYALSRELATEIANDPELSSSARIESVMKNGKQVGYQLFAIREDSAFEQLGLADGDIVESINGTALSSRAAADRAIAAAKTASRVELQIRRDGKRVAVSIDVLPAGEMHAFPIPPVPPTPVPPTPAPPAPAPAP